MVRLSRAALLAGFMSAPAAAAPESPAQVALEALERRNPTVRAVWREGAPVLITGLDLPTAGITTAERASGFVAARADLLGGATLAITDVDQLRDRALVRFSQLWRGLPVVDRSVVVTLDARGHVVRILNDSAPLIDVQPAVIDGVAARRLAAERVLGAGASITGLEAEKVVFAQGKHGIEGFVVRVPRVPFEVFEVRVDGVEGRVFGVQNTVLR